CGLLQFANCAHGYEAGAGVLLRFDDFTGFHRLGAPFVGHGDVFLAGSLVAVVQIGLAPVDQVQVGHGLVIIGPVVIGLGKVLQAFLDQRSILRNERVHDLLGGLGIAL